MSQFVWDPQVHLVRGDVHLEPQVVADLLVALGVQEAPFAVQAESVRGWLTSRGDEIDPLLRAGLERVGLPSTVTPSVQSPAASEVLKSRGSIVLIFGMTGTTAARQSWNRVSQSAQLEREVAASPG